MSMFVPTISERTLYGFIVCARLQYGDDAATQSYRLCNWSESVTIYEDDLDTPTNKTYTPYPFLIPQIKTETSEEVPNLQLTFPVTSSLYYIIKSSIDVLAGNPVTLFISTSELLDSASTNRLKFTYYIDNISFSQAGITINLSTKFNVGSLRLPKRQFERAICQYTYKDGINCPYDETELTDVSDYYKYIAGTGYQMYTQGFTITTSTSGTEPTIGSEIWTGSYGTATKASTSLGQGTITSVTLVSGTWGGIGVATIGINNAIGTFVTSTTLTATTTGTIGISSAINIPATACGKTLYDCALRKLAIKKSSVIDSFKQWKLLPFGGFPNIPTRDPRRL